jgi:hypothetical protein
LGDAAKLAGVGNESPQGLLRIRYEDFHFIESGVNAFFFLFAILFLKSNLLAGLIPIPGACISERQQVVGARRFRF